MTRDADLASNDKLELAERAAIANELGAALFVSLHNDSGGGDGAHVIHSIKGGLSKTLATNIANSIRDNTDQNLKKYNPIWSRSYVNSKGETVDYYGVIRMTNMPAVIVEHAYLDNAKDVQAINTPEKIESMGNAVAEGIYKTIQENFGRWEEKDGNKYYYDHNGVMQTGWLKSFDGSWYYFNEDGIMQTGWEKVDGKWYYLKSDGEMETGWIKLNEKWYYLRSSGVMAVGWEKVDGKWYYLKSDGVMAKGWLDLNGKRYYLKDNGEMVTGKVTIGNKTYNFDSSGALIK